MAAAAADVAFKVWYFPFRGRGGVIRAALAEAGLAWENKVLGRPEFGALREAAPNCASPFKQLPVLEDAKSGATFTQGAAILQYLGRVADPPLAPADAALDAQCLSYALTAEDLRIKYFEAPISSGTDEDRAKFKTEHLDGRWLPAFEAALTKTGTGFLVGDSITYADIAVWDILQVLASKIDGALDGYPKVAAFVEAISKRPRIAALLEDSAKWY